MKVTVYTVERDSYEDGFPTFATRAEAFADAREHAAQLEKGYTIDVSENVSIDAPPRQLAAALLSGQGWCETSRTIRTFKGKL